MLGRTSTVAAIVADNGGNDLGKAVLNAAFAPSIGWAGKTLTAECFVGAAALVLCELGERGLVNRGLRTWRPQCCRAASATISGPSDGA